MAAKRGRKSKVEGRHPHRRGRHLVDEAHERAHLRTRDRRFRREALGLRHDFVEIFDDDGRVGDDLAVMVEGRHDAVGVEREVAGLKLVAREQVELLLLERKLLGVEHEAHALAASRLRRVIKREGHLLIPSLRRG